LPWGYDFSMLTSFILYLVTAVVGQAMWKFQLPGGLSLGPFLEVSMYFGNVGMTLPVALYNIRQSYIEGTGKNRTFVESLRPLVSTSVAMLISFLWVVNSPNNILERDPRMVFYLTGTIFANICCKLIIAQMSNTRCELLSFILAPLLLSVVFVLSVPSLSLASELRVLYGLAFFVTVAHIHYGTCVVNQMCSHLKIRPFHIRNSSSPSDGDDKVKLLNGSGEAATLVGNGVGKQKSS